MSDALISRQAAAAGFLALVLFAAGRILYAAFFGSLSRVPGPLLCKVSGISDVWQTLVGGRRSAWIHELHEKYGPVVRIEPNLVAFADPALVKVIYSGKMQKANSRYAGKAIDGVAHSLLMNGQESRNRRNILLPLFQRANLETFEPRIHHYIAILCSQMEKQQDAEGSVELFNWTRLTAFDIICALAYGRDMKMTESGQKNNLVEIMAQVFLFLTLRDMIPVTATLARLRVFPPLSKLRKAPQIFNEYSAKIYEESLEDGTITDDTTNKKSLLQSLHLASKSDPTITARHVVTEAGAVMVAGSDTTSTAITYAIWELGRRPELMAKVRKELEGVTPDPRGDFDSKALETLPFFNAFLKEVLRVWPTLPGPLEREVSEAGMEYNGIFFLPGTEVTMTAYTVHRNAEIFPDPLEFLPERWLDETPEMKNAMLAFSYGTRACVGLNLAWLELRLITATILRRYDIKLCKETTVESMAPVEHFFSVPKSKRAFSSASCRTVIEFHQNAECIFPQAKLDFLMFALAVAMYSAICHVGLQIRKHIRMLFRKTKRCCTLMAPAK